MQFIRINQKRIQEVFTLLSFLVLVLTSLAPQILTVNKASASLFSYPKIRLDYTSPLPKPDGHPLKSSAQDVIYPQIKESESDFYYEADLGSFQVWFYDKAKQQAITRIGLDEQHFLEFFVPKEKMVPIELTEKGYSYLVSEDLKLEYTLKSGELKENIIISEIPSSDSFSLGYKKEGIILTEIQGEYYFYHQDSLEQLFKFKKPSVKDAKDQSGDISLEITKKELVFHLDQNFLKDASYPLTIDPVTVGNSTSTTGTGPNKDRHIVRTARGIIVKVWYQNSTNYLVGSRSLDDGETWLQLTADSAGATAIGGDTNTDGSYSIFADSSSNVNVAYTAATCDTSGSDRSACFRQLSPTAATEQFFVGSENTVYAGTATVPVDFPSVVETKNGTIYVAVDAEGSSGSDDAVAIRRSTNNGSSWGFETPTGDTIINDADDPVLIMEPETNERMYFYWKTGDNTLYHKYYNGTAWESEGSVANIGSTPKYSVATGSALPSEVHLVYTNSGVYYTRYNGSGWGNNTTLDSSGDAQDAVISYNGGDSFAFAAVTEGKVERIQYKKRTAAGTWDSNWTYVSDIIDSFESVQTYDASGASSYTNETTDAGDYGTADVPFLDDPTNDYLYVGRDATFSSMTFFLSTNASSTVTPDWEYWNGSTWTDLSETDNTSGFTSSPGDVNWPTEPVGWTTTTVNGISKYWVRVTGASSPATTPVASYILPEQHADSTTSVERVTEEDTFEQTSQDGFGDSDNQEGWSLEVFDDYLYFGTSHANAGAELWRSDDGIDWSQVSTNGFGNTNNTDFFAIATAGEYLYVGTQNSTNGAQVWRSANGTGFSQVNSDGFGDSNNTLIASMAVFNSYLYVGTQNTSTGTEIWRCDITSCGGAVSWSQVNSDGFGGATNILTAFLKEVDLAGTKYLYAGTRQSGGGDLWRCSESSGCDASGDWSSVSTDGFGDSGNLIMVSGEIFNDYFYVGTWNNSGTEIWRCNTNAAGACDANADFSMINTNGFGDSNTKSTNTLKSYYGNYLYVGTQNTSTGAELWRCTLASACDASGDWSQINSDGFGDLNNEYINDFQLFRDYLYMAVSDNTNGLASFRNFYERISVGWTAGATSPFDVKYDEIRYRARQENWRWYDDQTAGDPSTDFAAENTAASGIGKENAIRLRITLREDGHYDAVNIRMKLQYSTDDSQFFDVAGADETYAPWRYFDGGGTDDSTIGTKNLTDSDTSGPYVEELLVVSTFDHGAQDWTEWDFSFENYNATANATYYFRVVWADSEEEVVLTSGKSHPSLTTATSYILSLDGPGGINFNDYTLGGSGNSAYTFNSSEIITMRDDTGSGDGWSVTATSTDLTEDHSWSAADPTGSGNGQIKSLAVYNNFLYLGTRNAGGGEIWRTNDGSSWTAVVDNAIDGDSSGSDENGFGDTNNDNINTLFVYDDYLYATTRNDTTGIEIWRSNNPNGGDTWSQVNSDGFGDANNFWADSVAVLSGDAPGVYIGTDKDTPGTNGGAELWKCTSASGCDASGDWGQVNTDGFGDNDNQAIDSLQEFGSNLYVGIDRANSSAAELWRCDKSLTTCSTQANWSLVDDTGFGNSNNTAISSMASYNSNLYAFTENGTNGTQAWRCSTASGCDAVGDFAQTNNNGFGGGSNRSNTLAAYVWESDYDYLYVGTTSATGGAEVYWSEDGNNWNDANVGGGSSEQNVLDLMDFSDNIFAGMSKEGGIPGVGANIKKSADADIIIASDIDWSTGTITALLAASLDGVSAGAGGAMDPDTSVTVTTANSSGCTPDPPGCGAGGYTIQPTLTVSDLNNEDDGNYSATLTLTIQ